MFVHLMVHQPLKVLLKWFLLTLDHNSDNIKSFCPPGSLVESVGIIKPQDFQRFEPIMTLGHESRQAPPTRDDVTRPRPGQY